MKKKKVGGSVADKIMKVMNNHSMTAEDIKKELKDTHGYKIELQDIRVNLLYLLRREKIRRQKTGEGYKYSL